MLVLQLGPQRGQQSWPQVAPVALLLSPLALQASLQLVLHQVLLLMAQLQTTSVGEVAEMQEESAHQDAAQ